MFSAALDDAPLGMTVVKHPPHHLVSLPLMMRAVVEVMSAVVMVVEVMSAVVMVAWQWLKLM